MKRLRRLIQRILLYLLKKIDTPLPYSEFKYANLREIASTVDSIVQAMLPCQISSLRLDIGTDYAVIEYKSQLSIVNAIINSEALNNPDITLNISNTFAVIINGIDNHPIVKQILINYIESYLKTNQFIN